MVFAEDENQKFDWQLLFALGLVVLGMLLIWLAFSTPVKSAERVPPVVVASPAETGRLVVAEQLRLDPEEVGAIRWLTMGELSEEDRVECVLVWYWWINQLSTNPITAFPRQVMLGGKLPALEIDIRDYGWTPEAWAAVAERHPYFAAPWVDERIVDLGNKTIGYVPVNFTGDETPFIPAVRADWLLRETMELAKSPAYLDLLFARQRYKAVAEVKEVVRAGEVKKVVIKHHGGNLKAPEGAIGFPPGKVFTNLKPGLWEFKIQEKQIIQIMGGQKIQFVDFPANVDDWNNFFGIKNAEEHEAAFHIQSKYGAISAGSNDDPRRGSYVARHNRLLEFINGAWGLTSRSFDSGATFGERDYLQESGNIIRGKIVFDAGELLATLPNGAQASFLINAKGVRQTAAPGDFVHNFSEMQLSERARYADVRVPMHCVGCHNGDGGWISPRNLVKELLDDGVSVKFDQKQEANRFKAYFTEWEDRLDDARRPYTRILNKASFEAGATVKSAEMTHAYFACRDTYDAPVSVGQQAKEVGLHPDDYKTVVKASARARLAWAAQGKAIPRETWQNGEFREAALLAELFRARGR